MTLFTSQGQAKRFFVDKIVAQATLEGQPLSENERWMLSWSESDPEFDVDVARASAREAEISDEEYEKKAAGLAERAFAKDIASDPGALTIYKDAYRVLSEGDHYILIILDPGVAKRLHPWWAFWR